MARLLHEFFMKLLGRGNPSYQQVAPKKSNEIYLFFCESQLYVYLHILYMRLLRLLAYFLKIACC